MAHAVKVLNIWFIHSGTIVYTLLQGNKALQSGFGRVRMKPRQFIWLDEMIILQNNGRMVKHDSVYAVLSLSFIIRGDMAHISVVNNGCLYTPCAVQPWRLSQWAKNEGKMFKLLLLIYSDARNITIQPRKQQGLKKNKTKQWIFLNSVQLGCSKVGIQGFSSRDKAALFGMTLNAAAFSVWC